MARSPKDSKHQPRTTPVTNLLSTLGDLSHRFRTVARPAAHALVVDSKVVTGTALQCTAVAGYKPALPGNGHNALVVDLKVVTGTALQHTAVAGYKPALPGNGPNALVVDLKVVTGTALQHTAVAGYKPALPGNGPNALVVDLNVVTGTALQHTAVAGCKPALPGNETCEMTCARYSHEHKSSNRQQWIALCR